MSEPLEVKTQTFRTDGDNGDRFHRQLEVVDNAALQNAMVHVIGCGAVGSMTAVLLAKMGIGHIILQDFDSVELHNLPNQYFPEDAVGQRKVDALAKVLGQYGAAAVTTMHGKFEKGQAITPGAIVIVAVDNMEARKYIWEDSCRSNFNVPRFIEARMAAESFRIYSLRTTSLTSQQTYEKTLYSSAEVEPVKCTEKAIIYNIAVLGGLIANAVRESITDCLAEEYEVLGDLKNVYFTKTALEING